MKESVGFICDSSADFPPGMIKELGLHVLPVHIFVDEKEYLHGQTIRNEDVIKALKNKREVFTKPFFPHECLELFNRLLEKYEQLVCLHISSDLSGIYKSARMAMGMLRDEQRTRVHLIDLKTVSIHMGLTVQRAVYRLRSGRSVDDLKAMLPAYRANSFMGFTVDSLHWLRRGGRISALQSLVGGVLNIKPIIVLDQDRLMPREKHRGKKTALKRLVGMAAEMNRQMRNNCDIWLGYTDNLEEVMVTREKLAAAIDRKTEELKLVQLGATISAHTGPGCVGVAMIGG